MPSATFRWTTLNVQWTDSDIVVEIPYPVSLPHPHLFAGLTVNWGASDIPSHLASEYLNPNPPSQRAYYAAFVSGEGGLKVIVLTIRGGEVVGSRVESLPPWNLSLPSWLEDPYQFANNIPYAISVGPAPYGGRLLPAGTGWIANAFSQLTFQTVGGEKVPILWVGFFFVRDNTIVTPTNIRLIFCGIPVEIPDLNAVWLQFAPTVSLIDDNRTWNTYPLASLEDRLFFPASSLVAGSPTPIEVEVPPEGSVRFFSIYVSLHIDGSLRPVVESWRLWDVLMPVCYSPSRVLNNFRAVYGNKAYVVSPYDGIYAYMSNDTSSFLLNSGSTNLLVPSPHLLGACMDNYNLYGGDYRTLYATDYGRTSPYTPTVIAYTKSKESTGLSFKRAVISSSIAEAYTLTSSPQAYIQYIKPPLQVWTLEDKGYIVWENKADRVDFVNSVRSVDISIGGTQTIKLLHPCSTTFPTYLLASLPNYYGGLPRVFTLIASNHGSIFEIDDPIVSNVNIGRISPPAFIPTTGKACFGVYIPAFLFPTVDRVIERTQIPGTLYIVERQGDNTTYPITPLSVTQTSSGEIVVTFEMPITGNYYLGFVVHNPPYPSFPITNPTAHIIADSVANEWGWEYEVSPNTWVPFRGALRKPDATSPPFKVRVTIYPRHSRYVRVLAYRV